VFYDKFVYLCNQRDISPSKAAVDAGISKSLVTKWRTNNVKLPSPDVLTKLSKFFNIPVSELIDEENEKTPTQKGERDGSEIMFALSHGGEQEITDEMFDEVKKFAEYIAQRERK
jgi:transcriptional regulator with XRE-family HTH domain